MRFCECIALLKICVSLPESDTALPLICTCLISHLLPVYSGGQLVNKDRSML